MPGCLHRSADADLSRQAVAGDDPRGGGKLAEIEIRVTAEADLVVTSAQFGQRAVGDQGTHLTRCDLTAPRQAAHRRNVVTLFAPAASHVTAIDSAPETLQIARARPGCAGVDFHIGDAYALPEPPDRFDAAFAGFWYSHVPLARVRAFLQGLQARLQPGSRVVLLDNRYVAGSSTAISETDADGNTYQARPLADGSSHRVLKNFPVEAQLQAAIEGLGRGGQWRQWPHYWAFEYATRL